MPLPHQHAGPPVWRPWAAISAARPARNCSVLQLVPLSGVVKSCNNYTRVGQRCRQSCCWHHACVGVMKQASHVCKPRVRQTPLCNYLGCMASLTHQLLWVGQPLEFAMSHALHALPLNNKQILCSQPASSACCTRLMYPLHAPVARVRSSPSSHLASRASCPLFFCRPACAPHAAHSASPLPPYPERLYNLYSYPALFRSPPAVFTPLCLPALLQLYLACLFTYLPALAKGLPPLTLSRVHSSACTGACISALPCNLASPCNALEQTGTHLYNSDRLLATWRPEVGIGLGL